MTEADSSDCATESSPGSVGNVTPLFRRRAAAATATQPGLPANVTFDRAELREILGLYGRRVSEGEWRDYAINFLPQKAIFAVFRRSSEMPLYRIEKDPSLNTRQGKYAVIVATGLILRRGNDLTRVLAALEKKPRLVVV